MAKKQNTLNDLSAFLKADTIVEARDFFTEVETDYFHKKPTSLVDVAIDHSIETEQTEIQNVTKEAIPSNYESNPLMAYYNWVLDLQRNYFQFCITLQKGFFGK